MAPKLDIEHLTKVSDGTRILDDVSLQVAVGEVVTVIGPSGAGKSSFLRLLNRLDEPTAGTVYLDGVDYRTVDPQRLRQRLGLIPQEPALRSGTVYENVTIGPRLRDEPIDEERVGSLLERIDLRGYEARSVEDLSGGERQRVALARTLYIDPEVVLLDEPTAHLDSATETRIEALLADLIRDDLTCVLVTHDTAQAERLGDRVVQFENGRVVAEGSPEEIIT